MCLCMCIGEDKGSARARVSKREREGRVHGARERARDRSLPSPLAFAERAREDLALLRAPRVRIVPERAELSPARARGRLPPCRGASRGWSSLLLSCCETEVVR